MYTYDIYISLFVAGFFSRSHQYILHQYCVIVSWVLLILCLLLLMLFLVLMFCPLKFGLLMCTLVMPDVLRFYNCWCIYCWYWFHCQFHMFVIIVYFLCIAVFHLVFLIIFIVVFGVLFHPFIILFCLNLSLLFSNSFWVEYLIRRHLFLHLIPCYSMLSSSFFFFLHQSSIL